MSGNTRTYCGYAHRLSAPVRKVGFTANCSWGLCKNNTRKPDKLAADCKFIRFPKPKTNLEKCLWWIKACGRRHYQLNVSKIKSWTCVCNHSNQCQLLFPSKKLILQKLLTQFSELIQRFEGLTVLYKTVLSNKFE